MTLSSIRDEEKLGGTVARIRTLKPELWMDPKVGSLSHGARLTFVGLITQADDEGRLEYHPRMLRGRLFLWDDEVTDETIERWVAEVEATGMIRLYAQNGNQYIDLPNYPKHQKIDKPSPSPLPPFDESSGSPQ